MLSCRGAAAVPTQDVRLKLQTVKVEDLVKKEESEGEENVPTTRFELQTY